MHGRFKAWLMLPASAAFMTLTATGAVADQTGIGPWNREATRLARSSALVTTSMAFIRKEIAKIEDPLIRRETDDAVFNPDTCLKSRAGLTPERKQKILDTLVAEGLIDTAEEGRIPGGLLAGVFPGVRDDGTDCPRLPMPYVAAPGSVFGGHHSQPGGLAMHVAVNLTSAINLADTYRKVYGTPDARGLPVVRSNVGRSPNSDVFIDEDIAIGTPIWHDWAKAIVFQWNADGSEYIELNFGGNGKTDVFGAPGNSKTSAHHMIGIAETMARKLPPAFVIAQASAHGAPNAGNEHSAVNWLRSAAIMIGADPVERGYLMRDAAGRFRLAATRQLGSINVQASLPNQPNMLYEYVLQNLSDADFTYTGTASVQSDLFLRILAPKFNYDAADAARYNTGYRNPVLSHLSAERILMLYSSGGIGRVEAEINKVKAAGLIN